MRVRLQWIGSSVDRPTELGAVDADPPPNVPSARAVVQAVHACTGSRPWVLRPRVLDGAPTVVLTTDTGPLQVPPSRAPWAAPAWRDEITAWITHHVGAHRVVQHRVWARSTVLQVDTDSRRLWFKQSYGLPPGEGAALALAADQAATVPGFSVPQPVATAGARALMHPLTGRPLAHAPPSVWSDAITAVVRFQRAAPVDAWRALGCRDLTRIDWSSRLHDLFTRYELPVRWVDALAQRLSPLAAHPVVVLPWDLGPCNVHTVPDGIQAFDWSDVVIGPPGMLLDRWLTECDTPARRDAVVQGWMAAWGAGADRMWQDTRRCALLLEVLRYDDELAWVDADAPLAVNLRRQNRAQLQRQLEWCAEHLSPG